MNNHNSVGAITTKNQIGIMQGRLSPVPSGVIQSFPSETWRKEFSIAKECGFELIEWVFHQNDWEENPILSALGRKEIIQLQKTSGIEVGAICCDYFMEYPMLADIQRTQEMMKKLIEICSEVGIKFVELPFFQKNDFKGEKDIVSVAEMLNSFVPLAKQKGVYFLLEVGLTPKQTCALFERIPSPQVQINYDMGNSAYRGYNPEEEIPFYGHRIGNVHVKDCTPADYTVPLGKGNVDFDLVFSLLKKANYEGHFILQTARGKDDVRVAKDFYTFTNTYIQKYLK